MASAIEKNFKRDSNLTYDLSEKTFAEEPRDDVWATSVVSNVRDVASRSDKFSFEGGDCRTDICIFKIAARTTDGLARGSAGRNEFTQAAGPYDVVSFRSDGRAYVFKLVKGASYLKRFSDGR